MVDVAALISWTDTPNGGVRVVPGAAFFARVGGFIFGLLVARLLARAGQAAPREQWRSTA